ncbi:MAG TPA: hypothetical protein VKB41_09095 [Steroidobacteraceae bacterium]|jgi:hypothetical protein|nr:hypothetical protein [Steroidobacteraceae bacterium]
MGRQAGTDGEPDHREPYEDSYGIAGPGDEGEEEEEGEEDEYIEIEIVDDYIEDPEES